MDYFLLEINKATENDWNEILEILNETKLSYWFTGGESHHKFFIVRIKDSNEAVCCFQIAKENDVGILRSFAVRVKLQKSGIGRYIVDNLLPKIAKSLNLKRLYARGNDVGDFKTNGFWKKTIFQHIENSKIKDKFFRDDIESTIAKYPPELFHPESAFFLDLEIFS